MSNYKEQQKLKVERDLTNAKFLTFTLQIR